MSLEISSENVESVDWEEDCYKFCEFTGFTKDGGHISSDFTCCTFKDIEWYWGIFNIVNFIECKFINCTFKGTAFPDCKFVECEITNSKFEKDNLNANCDFENSSAYNCKIKNSIGFTVGNKNA